VPFPKQPRRYAMALINSFAPKLGTRRLPLLEILRYKPSPSSLSVRKQPCLENSETSRATATTVDSSDASLESHGSWASTEHINAQIELFNRRSNARLLTKVKEESLRNKETTIKSSTKRHSESNIDKPGLTWEYSEFQVTQKPSPKSKRSRSFTLGERFQSLSMNSLRGSYSNGVSLDVNSLLWDSDDEDG